MKKNVFKCIMMIIMILPLNVAMPQDNIPIPSPLIIPRKAKPFTYHVQENKMQYVDLSATSPLFDYGPLNKDTAPTYVREIPMRAGVGENFETIGLSAFREWVIAELPKNGDIYHKKQLISTPGSIPDSRGLVYIPNDDFEGVDTMTYYAVETTGNQTTSATITFKVNSAENYEMPLGFPADQWGLFIAAPSDPEEWPERESPIDWYIDLNCTNCAPFGSKGTPNQPRQFLPPGGTVFQAGAKIVIKGGTADDRYFLDNQGKHIWTFNGTAENPIFILGDDNSVTQPIISTSLDRPSTTALTCEGQNFVISGLAFYNVRLYGGRGSVNNAVVRHSEIAYGRMTNGTAVNLGGTRRSSNLSVFSCSIHNNGFRGSNFDEFDVHAMGYSTASESMILDVLCSGNGGDSYQHLQNNINGLVRIGRLKGHGEGENTVDIKAQAGVWVVDCDGWDMREINWSNGSGGNGQLFFQNDDDCSVGNCRQTGDIIFLNNRGSDSNGPMMESSIGGGRHYLVGNVAFDSPGSGMNIENSNGGGATETHAYFNTFSNVGIGMQSRPNASITRVAFNVVDNPRYNVWMLNPSNHTVFDYNFYTDDPETMIFQCCSNGNPNLIKGLSSWQTRTNQDLNSIAGVQADFNPDFSLQETSELIDQINQEQLDTIAPGIADMLNILGVTFEDAFGVQRPANGSYDAGASEFGAPGPGNPRPIARDDTATVDENSTNNNIDVLVNDVYRGDGASTDNPIVIVTAPDNGTATVDNRGTNTQGDDRVVYTPNAGYTGSDSLVYRIQDGNGDTNTARVSITVGVVATPPVANNDTVSVVQDSDVNMINVLANDENFNPDEDSIAIATAPANGTTSVNATNNSITYTPNAGFTGSDSFTYTLTDPNNVTSTATVSVTVTPVGDTTPIPLENGVPITDISGPDEAKFYYTLEVPVGATDLVFELTTPAGGSGNGDLYIGFEKAPTFTDNICKSESNSRPTNERCEISDPVQPGTYFVFVNPFKEAINNLTLTASYTVPIPSVPVLQNGVLVTDITAKKGEERRYIMVVPTGATDLSFKLIKGNGTGDADLYINLDAPATFTDRICASIGNTSNEECLIPDPVQPGVYHVLVNASNDIAGITLVGSYTESSSTAGADVANIMISPIPANDHINVQLPNVESGRVAVFDLVGNLLLEESFANTSKVALNVSSLPKRKLYVMKITTKDGRTYVKKMIK
ncbi:Ig-like domain-containing protein [Aquimarina megaterium]|uniref:Ig-like domain-containing protein n=1 Tax=Aquimarina megaterium TaxID=1443666 RepID=UPI000943DE1F|nr:Ig-like domain-containing protein [Aquimarina megaterium]